MKDLVNVAPLGRCIGCDLLRAALPVPRGHWDIVAGMVAQMRAEGGVPVEDVVVVVGAPALLPESLRHAAKSGVVLAALERAEAATLGGQFGKITHAAAPGHVWLVAAVGSHARGAVVVYRHRVAEAPTAEGAHWVGLARVREDGTAEGDGMSAPGGVA